MKRAKGTGLEGRIRRINNTYRKEGLAFGWQNFTSSIITKTGLKLLKSPVDFCLILKGGLFVCLDAKETSSLTSFPFANIKSHQTAFLEAVEAMGGKGYILVHPYKLYDDTGFLIPIKTILESKKKSIKFKLIEEHKVDLEDYLQLKENH